jgi:lipoprotein NlpD
MNLMKFPCQQRLLTLILTILCVGCSASRPAPIKDQSTQLSKTPPPVIVSNTPVTNKAGASPSSKGEKKPASANESKNTPTAQSKPVAESPITKTENTDSVIIPDPGFRIGKPSNGSILNGFNGNTNKGVDYVGKVGDPIVAVADGSVIFSGNSLRGYGNLVIVKHDNSYITVYAHNHKNLVKEGDVIKRSQKIAEMGNTETDQVKLHFELRRDSKPIDPSGYFDN